MEDYVVKLYKGCPETSGDTLEEMIEKGDLIPIAYTEEKDCLLPFGIYSCHITGKGIYPTLKMISLKEETTVSNLEKMLEDVVVGIRFSGEQVEGYQPTVVAPDAPEFFKRTQKDELLCIWPDEILDIYADRAVPEHHQSLTQETLEEWLVQLEDHGDFLKCYQMGTSPHYGFSIPMAILSKEHLTERSWETTLCQLRDSKKINVFYQAQIHGNEPAACEGAVAVLEALCIMNDVDGLLDKINLVVIPRANPEAAYLYRRMAYDNIDLNRDHMACEAYETRLLHKAFQLLEPEVVLDGHEFTFYVTEKEDGEGFVKKGCEIMSSPATSLNIDEAVRNCSYQICGQVFDDLKEKGYRIYHFGTSEKSSLGRAYYGLHQCLSFLIETRGIGGGRYGYEKRVRAQRDIMLSYIKNIAASAESIQETVAKARFRNRNTEKLVLHHGCSESVYTPYQGINEQYYLNGTLRGKAEEGLFLSDLALRSRILSPGYLIPGDVENIEQILEKVKLLDCNIQWLEPGTCLEAARYRYGGLREEETHEKDILAELTEENQVAFPQGAWHITATGSKEILLFMLMEPDVTDTVGTKGTLFQQDLLTYDEETGLFPLYRITAR